MAINRNVQFAVPIPYEQITALCGQYRIKRLALFGSVLRDDFDPETSDIDVLVEFEPEATPGYMGMAEIESYLTQIINRKVDLRTPQEVSRYFRDQVLEVATTIYEKS